MTTFRLYTIDAWHDGESWYANDTSPYDEVDAREIEGLSGDALLSVFEAHGFDVAGCAVEEWGGDPEFVTLVDESDGRPIAEIQVDVE